MLCFALPCLFHRPVSFCLWLYLSTCLQPSPPPHRAKGGSERGNLSFLLCFLPFILLSLIPARSRGDLKGIPLSSSLYQHNPTTTHNPQKTRRESKCSGKQDANNKSPTNRWNARLAGRAPGRPSPPGRLHGRGHETGEPGLLRCGGREPGGVAQCGARQGQGKTKQPAAAYLTGFRRYKCLVLPLKTGLYFACTKRVYVLVNEFKTQVMVTFLLIC